jgi:RHS repeat-associated protein
VVGYEYDAAGRVSTLSRNGQLYGFTYDFDGRLTTQTFPNGVHASYHYDAANRLLNLVNQKSNNSVISSFAYQYDRAGKPLRLTLADSEQIAYAYDARNQLVRETRNGGTATYDHEFIYDRVGNRTRLNSDGKAIEYTYDSADELTLEVTGQASTSYAYDRNGNQVQKTSGTDVSNYSYDSRNLLTGFATSAMSASYLHDVFGQRVSKSVGAATTQYVYDGFDAIAEYDGSGATRAQNFFAGGIDQNLARFSAGESLYYLTDGLGSVRNIVDGAEQSVNTYDYDAWGNFLSRIEGVANDYTFTGRQSDQESGLYYFRARMYDPAIGRFNGSDPFDSNSGRSLYAYVDNTPTAATDPLGRNLRNLVNDVLRIAAGLLFLWLAVLALGVVLTVVLAIAVAVIAENPPPDSQPPTGSNVASGDEKKDQYYACGVA